MSVTMVIRNVPDELSEPELRERISEALLVEQMEILPDKGPSWTTRQVVVQVDMPQFEADELAQKWTGRIVGGHPLQVTAMRFMR